MYERPHHQRIAHVLSALDASVLAQNACWFGGGTCIALKFGEYRESVDIDFLVSDPAGYRELRQWLTGLDGLAPITRQGAMPLELLREVRADQYGIRSQVRMDGHAIKFLNRALSPYPVSRARAARPNMRCQHPDADRPGGQQNVGQFRPPGR